MPTIKGILLNGSAWTVIPLVVSNTGSGSTTPPVVITQPPTTGGGTTGPTTGGGTTPTTTPGTSGGKPAVFSDIIWHQPQPIDPASEDYTIAGWGEPVGGIGPYVWSTPDAGNYACLAAYGNRGVVRVFGGMPTPANLTFRLRCTDARGVTITKTFAVVAASSSPTMSCNDINPTSNATLDTFYNGPTFRPTAPGVQSVYTNVTLQDGSASTQWVGNYGPKWSVGGAAVIPPGSYPVRFTGTSNGVAVHDDYTIVITATPTTGYIELDVAPMSTATLVGAKLGQARATTPTNSPTWSIDDGGNNYVTINDASGVVSVKGQPTTAGTFPFNVTVRDQSYTYTQAFSLVVATGQTLPSSNMTMTPNAFTNYAFRAEYNQRNVGTPTVSGFPDPSKIVWTVPAMERFNWMMDHPKSPLLVEDDDARGGIGRPRWACDPATGAVVVQAPLSDTTGTPGEWFDLSATDGVRVCTKRIYVPVTPVVGPKYYVGPAAAPAGMVKKASLTEALSPILGWPPETDVTAVAGLEIHVEADPANPNRYVNDWEQNYNLVRRGYNGPFKVIGIPASDGTLPYIGGPRGSSNVGVGDQGLFYLNQGDAVFENLELGFIHMGVFGGDYLPGSNRTMSLIRRSGGSSGDVTIRNCDLHNSDVPVEAGNSDGHWTFENVRITNGSGCTSGGGANQHNGYLGMVWKITATNLLSYNTADGHVLKTRAAQGTWNNCRFFDGERGSQFNALDLCCAGNHVLTNCHFEKGPSAQNPYIIQYGEEFPGVLPWNIPAEAYVNDVSFTGCTFTNHCPAPLHKEAIAYCGRVSPITGKPSSMTLTNCTFEGLASNQVVAIYSNLDSSFDFTPTFKNINPTYTTTYAPMDFSSPVSKDLGRPSWHDSVADLNHHMPFFDARQIDPGADELRIPANAAPGTVITSNMRAYGVPNWSLSGNAQPDPRINPFVAGTTWAPGTSTVDYTGTSFGYKTNLYTVTTNPDGITATLKVGPGGLSGAGCDIIVVRATSPSSTGSFVAETPLFIVKT